jgi:hypothetical protein
MLLMRWSFPSHAVAAEVMVMPRLTGVDVRHDPDVAGLL